MNTFEKLKTTTLKLRKERSPLGPTMQFHLAEIDKVGKNAGNRETTEDETIQYLKKAVAKLKENPHADAEEIAVLEGLLPQMVSMDEVRGYLSHLEATEGLDLSNKGSVMKAVKSHFGSLVDMKMVGTML